MRGDRPRRIVDGPKLVEAAPHARGSTLRHELVIDRVAGCPACAGIDPRRSFRRQSRARLPRMRGDRPQRSRDRPDRPWAAPHARGSTHELDDVPRCEVGCPACAGIDPTAVRGTSQRGRLPRMRGDRPIEPRPSRGNEEAAPHARGSTRTQRPAQARARGCPACAGIDPQAREGSAPVARLPRMRGDRPCSPDLRILRSPAAPHARGSTHMALTGERLTSGCPACAGIDPRGTSRRTPALRLPRMRGDRPLPIVVIPTMTRAAPHARGSTRAERRDREAPRGCPACAGIDPRSPASSSPARWLPRMRGDRPSTARATGWMDLAAPHARGSTQSSQVS